MADFNIGDTVIAIMDFGDDEQYGIKKGKEYTVFDIFSCGCGYISLDVGVKLPTTGGRTRCLCGDLVPGVGAWWFNSIRFIKKDGGKTVDVTEFMEIFIKKTIEIDNL